MNPLQRLLQDELNRLVDRIAAATREGTVADCAGRHPDLMSRIERAEASLTRARQGLIDGYAAWREALEECGDLWALADLATDGPVLATERQAA